MCKARVGMTVIALALGLVVSALILAGSTPQAEPVYRQRYMTGGGVFILLVETQVFTEVPGLANATHVVIVPDGTARRLEERGALLVDVARVDGSKTGVTTRYRIVAVDADTADGWTNVWLVRYG